MLGTCNGFQILCEAHLLPGALMRNAGLHYVCRDQRLRVENTGTALDLGLHRGPGDRPADQARRGPLRRRRGDPERAGGGRPGRLPLPRRQPQRLAERHRGHPQRGGQRRRAHAAPRARRRGPHRRPEHRRPRLLHLHPEEAGERMSLDTVKRAEETPDEPQPYAELGMKIDEYDRVREILGRRPTGSELAIYSVMWSEHCSYKSSKVHLRQFATKAPKSEALLVGMGENAGVVDIGDGWAATFKIESHNHPSYVEPHQGAATGVGGIVRDIMSMGARPIAVMDALRFGARGRPRHPAGAARRGRGHQPLRQLPRPAQHRRRGRLRPLLHRQPAGQRALRGPAPQGPDQAGHRPRAGQQGRPVRRADRPRRHRRRVRAGLGHVRGRVAGQAAQPSRWATRSWRSC